MQYLSETLENKWASILDHKDLPEIKDAHRRQVTGQILENQQSYLKEAAPTNLTTGIENWDPILISLVRRALPNLIAFDICGVQPMSGPTGLIFALKAEYTSQGGTEALADEAKTDFSGGGGTHTVADDTDPVDGVAAAATRYGGSAFTKTGQALLTATGEALSPPAQMAVSIDKISVTAKTRMLMASYSTEMAQDMKAVHGLDAETELSNILSAEILAEINREIVRTINTVAKVGALANTTADGVFDLDTDSNGRWSVEKFKGLMFEIERESNVIAKETRRGKGNFIITSSDVASALSMAGVLDHAPALQSNLNVDDTGNTFAGVLNGKTKVYVDPYFVSTAASPDTNYVTVGYKGTSPFDAGIFYCPYVPLQLVRALDESSFQPKIAFKTRYGVVTNPFVPGVDSTGTPTVNTNPYYRIFNVTNLM